MEDFGSEFLGLVLEVERGREVVWWGSRKISGTDISEFGVKSKPEKS